MDVDDVHDGTRVLGELGRRLLADEERRAQVRADQLLPVRRLDVADRHREKGRRIVHQHVQPAEGVHRGADQRAGRNRREELRLHLRRAFRAQRIELGFELHRIGFRIAVMDEHRGPRGMQAPRDGRSQPTRAARDQHALSGERLIHKCFRF